MKVNDTVLTFPIDKLPLLFKLSKERDAAICLHCRAEVLRSKAFLMELGKGWNQAQQSLHCAGDHSCARPALKVRCAFRWFRCYAYVKVQEPRVFSLREIVVNVFTGTTSKSKNAEKEMIIELCGRRQCFLCSVFK